MAGFDLYQAGLDFGAAATGAPTETSGIFGKLKAAAGNLGNVVRTSGQTIFDTGVGVLNGAIGGTRDFFDSSIFNFDRQSALGQLEGQRIVTAAAPGLGDQTSAQAQVRSRDVLIMATVAGAVVLGTILFKRG